MHLITLMILVYLMIPKIIEIIDCCIYNKITCEWYRKFLILWVFVSVYGNEKENEFFLSD